MIKNIAKVITSCIHKETGRLAIATDNNNKKPPYPYYSYKFITQILRPDGSSKYVELVESEDERFEYDVQETLVMDSKTIVSFNAYSKDIFEAQAEIMKAWEWFKHKAYYYFADNNLVIVDVSDIQDRTIHIVDHYEYRLGFDVEIRLLHKIERTVETIETYEIKGGIE